MNTLPLHPAVVHVPLGLALVMPLLLGVMVWAIATDRLPGRAWLLALVLQGLILAAAAVALRTGEQDEERFEARTGEAGIAAHERAARAFTGTAAGTFAAAVVALALRHRRRPFVLAGATSVVLSVGMLALGIQAGHRGGALVHGGAALAVPGEGVADPGTAETAEKESSEQDDDD
ncbi:MAG TPA: hypothetical protein VLT82_19685 [Myxococcaceae bacterium]|nr:hypothetical protein [Myxococcaceae bacterium]